MAGMKIVGSHGRTKDPPTEFVASALVELALFGYGVSAGIVGCFSTV